MADGAGNDDARLLVVLEGARALGLLGSASVAAQMAHAAGFADAAEAWHPPDPGAPWPGLWMDMGSGGGLPGLVLAHRWPSAGAVLLDAGDRRARFLSEAVATLGWQSRVDVVRARAEDEARARGRRGSFDLVVARSFGSPPVTAECASPFLRPGGLLVVSEPPPLVPGRGHGRTTTERWPRTGLAILGMEPVAQWRSGSGYQVLRQGAPCPDRFPRRVGVAAKRPLYPVVEG